MPVIKGKYSLNFTSIPNSTLQDAKLSFEARGVLSLMLSMPSDWVMYKSWIIDQCPNTGRDKVSRILKELEVSGYLERHKERDDKGRFDSYIWFVYPEPSPANGLAVNGLAVNGKPAPTKDTYIQNKQHTNEDEKTDDIEEVIRYEEIRDLFNQILGERIGKVRAITSKRKKHIRARISEDPKRKEAEWWEAFFHVVSDVSFLMGNNDRRWKCDIDWLINETNMVKVLEGKYDNS